MFFNFLFHLLIESMILLSAINYYKFLFFAYLLINYSIVQIIEKILNIVILMITYSIHNTVLMKSKVIYNSIIYYK